jgi:carboxylesterase type B
LYDGEVRQVVADLYSDTQFRYVMRELLKIESGSNVTEFACTFSRHRNGRSGSPIHGDGLQYVFGTLNAPHRGKTIGFDSTDQSLSDEMASRWAQFAKTGNPNIQSGVTWQPFNVRQSDIDFGDAVAEKPDSENVRLDFIRDFYAKRRSAGQL